MQCLILELRVDIELEKESRGQNRLVPFHGHISDIPLDIFLRKRKSIGLLVLKRWKSIYRPREVQYKHMQDTISAHSL